MDSGMMPTGDQARWLNSKSNSLSSRCVTRSLSSFCCCLSAPSRRVRPRHKRSLFRRRRTRKRSSMRGGASTQRSCGRRKDPFFLMCRSRVPLIWCVTSLPLGRWLRTSRRIRGTENVIRQLSGSQVVTAIQLVMSGRGNHETTTNR